MWMLDVGLWGWRNMEQETEETDSGEEETEGRDWTRQHTSEGAGCDGLAAAHTIAGPGWGGDLAGC